MLLWIHRMGIIVEAKKKSYYFCSILFSRSLKYSENFEYEKTRKNYIFRHAQFSLPYSMCHSLSVSNKIYILQYFIVVCFIYILVHTDWNTDGHDISSIHFSNQSFLPTTHQWWNRKRERKSFFALSESHFPSLFGFFVFCSHVYIWTTFHLSWENKIWKGHLSALA